MSEPTATALRDTLYDLWQNRRYNSDPWVEMVPILAAALAAARQAGREDAAQALADLVDLVTAWQGGIFAKLGITWTADPPALVRAREILALRAAPEGTR